MSHDLTPAPTLDTVRVPDDGESAAASAPGIPASVVTLEEVVQQAVNRVEFTRLGPYHGARHYVRAEVRDVAGNRGWVLRPTARLAIDGTGAGPMRAFATSIDSSLALGVLTASTWYYVYAYDNAGVLGLEASSTAPTASLLSKTGDSTRSYLGCFRTDSAGLAIPMVQNGNRYLFRAGHPDIAALELDLGTTAGQPAGFYTVAAKIPPHVDNAVIEYGVASGGAVTAARSGGVATTGDNITSWTQVFATGEINRVKASMAELPVIGGTLDLYASHAELVTDARLRGFTE